MPKKQPVRVILEPWASEWILDSDDYLDFISVTDSAQNGWFMVEDSSHGLIVWAQESGMLVHVYDSKGYLID